MTRLSFIPAGRNRKSKGIRGRLPLQTKRNSRFTLTYQISAGFFSKGMSLQSRIGGSAKGGLDSARRSNCYTTFFFQSRLRENAIHYYD